MNVAAQAGDSRSMLALYKALIALRRAEPTLGIGDHVYARARGAVLTYLRRYRDRRALIALNFSDAPQEVPVHAPGHRILLSTHLDRANEQASGVVRLRPHEGVVIGGPAAD
jgi:alpha-glucosidase